MCTKALLLALGAALVIPGCSTYEYRGLYVTDLRVASTGFVGKPVSVEIEYLATNCTPLHALEAKVDNEARRVEIRGTTAMRVPILFHPAPTCAGSTHQIATVVFTPGTSGRYEVIASDAAELPPKSIEVE